jgi:hypothetical protein
MQDTTRALRGILYYWNSLLSRQLSDADDIRWITIKMRYDDCVDTAPDRRTNRIEIRAQRQRIHVVQSHSDSGSDGCGSKIYARVSGIRDRSSGADNSAQGEDQGGRAAVSQQRVDVSVPLPEN